MLWSMVIVYAVVSAFAGLLIGRGIRVCDEEVRAPAEPAVEPEEVPVVAAHAWSPDSAAVDVHAVRAFTGRTPRALRPPWQRTALRTLGL